MPYANERASRLGHVPLASKADLMSAFSRYEVAAAGPVTARDVAALCTDISALGGVGLAPTRVISIDGSDDETPPLSDFPSARMAFLQATAVLTDMTALRASYDGHTVDPVALRKSYSASTLTALLPGSGVVSPGMTGKDSWRQAVNDFLLSTPFDPSSDVTLADLLVRLHGEDREALAVRACPVCGTRFADGAEPLVYLDGDGDACTHCGARLMLADAARISDDHSEMDSNMVPLTRLMNLVERLMMAGYIEQVALTSDPQQALAEHLFITDGPLALFGSTAPLKRPMQSYLARVARGSGAQPLLVGMEKSGRFYEHAQMLARDDLVGPGQVMTVPNWYINRIDGRHEGHAYGRDEFYGRRFFFRTRAGDMHVITVPPRAGAEPYSTAPATERVDTYPGLRAACEALDGMRTLLFPNAVIPVALAHRSSSIPRGIGRTVLTELSQRGLGLPSERRRAAREPDHRG